MGTVLLTLVWPDTTDSLVTDSLPSRYKEEEERKEENTLSQLYLLIMKQKSKSGHQHQLNK